MKVDGYPFPEGGDLWRGHDKPRLMGVAPRHRSFSGGTILFFPCFPSICCKFKFRDSIEDSIFHFFEFAMYFFCKCTHHNICMFFSYVYIYIYITYPLYKYAWRPAPLKI